MDIHFHAGQPEELELTARFLTDLAAIRSRQFADAQAAWGGRLGNLNGQAGGTQAYPGPAESQKPAKDTGKPGKAGKEPKPNPSAAAGATTGAGQQPTSAISPTTPTASAPSVEEVRKKISALTDGEETRARLSALMKNEFKVTSLVDLPDDQRVAFLEKAKVIATEAGLTWTE